MGMFDNIVCEYPLPDKEVQNEVFQTKSFDEPNLDNYGIDVEGYLWKDKREYYTIPEEERPYYGKPEWNRNKFYKLIGSVGTRTYGKEYMEDFTGEIVFYTFIDKEVDNEGQVIDADWYEYNATFTNGQLDKLEKVVERN